MCRPVQLDAPTPRASHPSVHTPPGCSECESRRGFKGSLCLLGLAIIAALVSCGEFFFFLFVELTRLDCVASCCHLARLFMLKQVWNLTAEEPGQVDAWGEALAAFMEVRNVPAFSLFTAKHAGQNGCIMQIVICACFSKYQRTHILCAQ